MTGVSAGRIDARADRATLFWLYGVRTVTSADAGRSDSFRRHAPPTHRISRRRAPDRQRPGGSPSPTALGDRRRRRRAHRTLRRTGVPTSDHPDNPGPSARIRQLGWTPTGGPPVFGPLRVRDARVSWACVAASSTMFSGQAVRTVSTTRWRSTHRSRVMRKVGAAPPGWWATSAVPYRYFWLLPSAGVVIGLGAASAFGVPVWLGFICAETPALALEAWWRHAHPPSGDTR